MFASTWTRAWVLVSCLAAAAGCTGGGAVPANVEGPARVRLAELDPRARGVFWLRVSEDAEAAFLSSSDAKKVGRVGETLVIECSVSQFLEAAARREVERAGYVSSPMGAGKMDGPLRLALYDAIDDGSSEPIRCIARLDPAAGPVGGRMSELGARIDALSAESASLAAEPAVLGRIAELDAVSRLEADAIFDPLN